MEPKQQKALIGLIVITCISVIIIVRSIIISEPTLLETFPVEEESSFSNELIDESYSCDITNKIEPNIQDEPYSDDIISEEIISSLEMTSIMEAMS